jgi:NAD(P)-dependent dehydrogenase (short-subunit alcohol dehydrogenase family)
LGTLDGKVAVITGAGGGIGAATAGRFARAGARLVLADIDPEKGVAAEAAIRAMGADARFVETDVTHPPAVQHMADRAVQHFGGIDALFHVAGGSGRRRGDGPVDRCTLEGWDWTLNLNLRSAFLCARAALPHMLETGGSILFLSSVQGLVGGGSWFDTHAYATAKTALVGLTRSMATYYAPRGVRVNVLCPGTIRTPMSARTMTDPDVAGYVTRMQPLTGGPGEPEDVAEAALFLSSDAARFITGVALPVDGGWTSF